jgi:hypothetical protein
LADRMSNAGELHAVAAADADRPMVVPEVDEILEVLTQPPRAAPGNSVASGSRAQSA